MWRLKHIHTGLYWQESDGGTNSLSKRGTNFRSPEEAEELRQTSPEVISIGGTQSYRKCTAVEGWKGSKEEFNKITYQTSSEDWEVEEIEL